MRIIDRISLYWKLILVYIVWSALFGALLYFLAAELNGLLEVKLGISLGELLGDRANVLFRGIAVAFLAGFSILGLLYLNLRQFISDINQIMFTALDSRQLANSLSKFYSGRTIVSVRHNLKELFLLLRGFDHLKTSRVSIETRNIAVLMSNIQEGVIIVDGDKVVSHVNHPFETLFKLIPDEIIGQVITRKISHPEFLGYLSRVLKESQKITNKEIELSETQKVCVSVFPIADRNGDVWRAMAVVSKLPEAPTPVE